MLPFLASSVLGMALKLGAKGMATTAVSNAKADFAAIPPKTRLYLLAGLAIGAALLWHVIHEHRAMKKAVAAAYAQGRDDYAAKVEKQAREIEAKAVTITSGINQVIKDTHNEELGRINATRDALIVRGPGKAECRDPAVPAASGGRDGATGTANAAVDRLPYPQWSALMAMPFDDAARFGAQHDAFRDEVKSWHEWWPKMNAAIEQLRAEQSKGAK